MRKEYLYYVVLPIAAYLGIIWMVSSLDIPSWLCMILLIMVSCAYVLFFSRIEKLDRVKKKIVSKLRAEGYECSIEEEVIVVTKQQRKWQVYIFESEFHNVFTVYFTDFFVVGTPEDVHWVGSNVLMSAANTEFPQVKVTGDEGAYMCQYQSVIRNADDFMVVYREAWNNIMQTIKWMRDNWDETVRRFPASKEKTEHKIGF